MPSRKGSKFEDWYLVRWISLCYTGPLASLSFENEYVFKRKYHSVKVCRLSKHYQLYQISFLSRNRMKSYKITCIHGLLLR